MNKSNNSIKLLTYLVPQLLGSFILGIVFSVMVYAFATAANGKILHSESTKYSITDKNRKSTQQLLEGIYHDTDRGLIVVSTTSMDNN